MNQTSKKAIDNNINLTYKPTRRPADRNSKIIRHQSPKRQVPERQLIAELQEDLRRTKQQLASTESQKGLLQHEFEDAKNQLSIMHTKYLESKQEKLDLAASEEARIQELRKVFQERDRSWQSELEAVQNSCINEIQSVKMHHSKVMKSSHSQLLELKHEIDDLKIQLIDSEQQLEITKNTIESLNSKYAMLEKSGDQEKLVEELKQLMVALETSVVKHSEEQIMNMVVIQSAYELEEQLRNELLEKENKIKKVSQINESLNITIAELKEQIIDKETELERVFTIKDEMEIELKKLRVQSEQWRKASEAAMVLISNENNGNFGDKLINFPLLDHMDEESKKLKNNTLLRKMGELWKKGQK